jgi:hypothetical protein
VSFGYDETADSLLGRRGLRSPNYSGKLSPTLLKPFFLTAQHFNSLTARTSPEKEVEFMCFLLRL